MFVTALFKVFILIMMTDSGGCFWKIKSQTSFSFSFSLKRVKEWQSARTPPPDYYCYLWVKLCGNISLCANAFQIPKSVTVCSASASRLNHSITTNLWMMCKCLWYIYRTNVGIFLVGKVTWNKKKTCRVAGVWVFGAAHAGGTIGSSDLMDHRQLPGGESPHCGALTRPSPPFSSPPTHSVKTNSPSGR